MGENVLSERSDPIVREFLTMCSGVSRGMAMLNIWWLALFLSVSLLGSAAASHAADEEYDQDGRLVRSVDESGEEVQYRYDEAGRIAEEQHSDGSTIRHEMGEEPSEE
jgi:YD repeat-containing protein